MKKVLSIMLVFLMIGLIAVSGCVDTTEEDEMEDEDEDTEEDDINNENRDEEESTNEEEFPED